MSDDIYILSRDHVRRQLEMAPFRLGFYTLKFYVENGHPATKQTGMVDEFYLYPSGGTLRDSLFNIVFYDSQFDTYRGFILPHKSSSV